MRDICFPWHYLYPGVDDGARVAFLYVPDDFGNLHRVDAMTVVAVGASMYLD